MAKRRSNRIRRKNSKRKTYKRKRTYKKKRLSKKMRGGVSISNYNIEFFIFQEKQPKDKPDPQLTQISDHNNLKNEIIKLSKQCFPDYGDDLHDGFYIVGLLESDGGLIEVNSKSYELVYSNSVNKVPINILKNEILENRGIIPKSYEPLDLSGVVTQYWPVKIEGELLFDRKILDYCWFSVCKSIDKKYKSLKIFSHIMNNIWKTNFFKNGRDVYINIYDLFNKLDPDSDPDSNIITFYIIPEGNSKILNEYKDLIEGKPPHIYYYIKENESILGEYISYSNKLKEYYKSLGFSEIGMAFSFQTDYKSYKNKIYELLLSSLLKLSRHIGAYDGDYIEERRP